MNHLANESSPYLIQHRENPVDWWPWCSEALSLARSLDRPIFLSIGYSSCHWCHVMAHESFEDAVTARLLNSRFISIKVDREERPDIDALYMEAVMILTGSGGWPMSVFLTPDGKPFYAGTYFPPRGTGRSTSFYGLLNTLSEAWEHRRQEVEQQADEVVRAIRHKTEIKNTSFGVDIGLAPSYIDTAAAQLLDNFDHNWGGFGFAPKFPQPSSLELLFYHHLKTKSAETIEAAATSLDAMASGGIYDHLAGGFARYSVDERWLVPHFEKMLYDQAQMAKIYAIGWAVSRNPGWKQVAEETVDYVLSTLRDPGKGLYSSQDADSEGVEGKYYLFNIKEISELLGADSEEFIRHFGMTAKGNFEGSNILHLPTRGDFARSVKLEDARLKVLAARRLRKPPGTDDKVVLEWNAMFVATLSQIGFLMGRNDWISEGQSLLAFLEESMLRSGRWMRTWRKGTGSQQAFASDYAHLVNAYTRTYEATGNPRFLAAAIDVANQLIELFEDPADGGFYSAGTDQEQLIHRTKDLLDGATPSANSVAALSLARLWKLTDRSVFRNSSLRVVNLLNQGIAHHPGAFPLLIQTLTLLNGDSHDVVIPGHAHALIAALQGRWLPDGVVSFGERIDSPLWEGRKEGYAYICRNFSCQQPVSKAIEFATALDSLH